MSAISKVNSIALNNSHNLRKILTNHALVPDIKTCYSIVTGKKQASVQSFEKLRGKSENKFSDNKFMPFTPNGGVNFAMLLAWQNRHKLDIEKGKVISMKLNLGNQIRMNRRRMNLTQEQLAEEFGTSPQAISRWETGESLS